MALKKIVLDTNVVESSLRSRYESMQFFVERAKDFNEQDFLDALQEVPAVEPEEQDHLPA